MLELKNIGAKNKNKIILKDLNIKFNRTGLISFINGTEEQNNNLLDIIGGFKRAELGELIINGKSSNDLQNDSLDAYRNTYVGVIKNEGQFIGTSSIASNVKRSLEIQGKEISSTELRKILDAVGLTNIKSTIQLKYLSELQKQQVAVARALIKNPIVIIAYEPALKLNASETREYYNLLKRVSQTRLVIFISKDIETTKQVADRYFVIKDNTVVDDSKVEIIENVASNFGLIEPHITNNQIQSEASSALFSNFLLFFFTLIILIITLLITNLYFSKNEFNLREIYMDSIREFGEVKIINNIDEEKIKNETNEIFNKEILVRKNEQDSYLLFPKTKNDNIYYKKSLQLSFSVNDNIEVLGQKPIEGNQIVISKYIADQIIKNGIYNGNIYTASTYDDIINNKPIITINNLGDFRIVGILNENLEKYEILKTTLPSELDNITNNLYEDLNYEINNKLNRIYVSNNFINHINIKDDTIFNKTIKVKTANNIFKVSKIGYLSGDTEIITENGKIKINKLNEDEILVSKNLINDLYDGSFNKHYEAYKQETNDKTEEGYYSFLLKFIGDRLLLNEEIKTNISGTFTDYKVIGLIDCNEDIVLCNESLVNDLKQSQIFLNALYSNTFTDYDIENTKTRFSEEYNNLKVIFSYEDKLFMYALIIMPILSIVLVIMLINNSIKNRKYSLSIYRLLGANRKQIKYIFLSELIQLFIISVVATMFISKYAATYINNYLSNSFNSTIVLFNYNYINIVIMAITSIILIIFTYLLSLNKIKKNL